MDELDHCSIQRPAADFMYRDQIEKIGALNGELLVDIEDYKEERETFHRLCDRAALLGLSRQEKDRFFEILLNYFLALHKENKFNLVIVFDTPHSFYSYLFYQVLVRDGVAVVRLEQHFLQDFSILKDGGPSPNVPPDYLASSSIQELQSKMSPILLKTLKGENSYFIKWAGKEKRWSPGGSLSQRAKTFFRFQRKQLVNLVLGAFPILFRKHHHGNLSLNIRVSDLKYRVALNGILRKQRDLLATYLTLVQEPDLHSNYIYFALHMQPEKTSMPMAGKFADQLVAIRALSQALPQGWALYIKEHPNQFNPALPSNALFRSKAFYKSISELDNIILVAQDFPSDQLIEYSQMVATLTGSVGWEALSNGKPVIAFGEAYYASCRACLQPQTADDCRLAIRSLRLLSRENVRSEFIRHLLFLEEQDILVPAGRSSQELSSSAIPFDKHVDRMSSAINDVIVTIFSLEE